MRDKNDPAIPTLQERQSEDAEHEDGRRLAPWFSFCFDTTSLLKMRDRLRASPIASFKLIEIVSPTYFMPEQSHITIIQPPMGITRDPSAEPASSEDDGLATVPMRSLYGLTKIRNLSSNN